MAPTSMCPSGLICGSPSACEWEGGTPLAMQLPRALFDVDDLSDQAVQAILARASELASGAETSRPYAGRTVGLFFSQPSTRTRVGFTAAVARLAGTVADVCGPKFQDGMDGPESIADTARVLDDYCDVLVIRHASESAVREFAHAAEVPVINGGAGRVAHPTQALIDLFAIQRSVGRLDALRVGIMGDLANSRTGRSLFKALVRFAPTEIRLLAPAGRQLPDETTASAGALEVTRGEALALQGLDVLYVAGMPPGTGDAHLPLAVRERFYVTRARLAAMNPSAAVLCALPRTGDIDPDADGDPRSHYFRQSAEGLFVRMALLEAYAAPVAP